MKKQLLILIALSYSTIGLSQTFTTLDNNNNTLEFNITSTTTVEVKDYISGGTAIDIPATVSNNGITYSVTGIGTLAFYNNGLTSAVMPNSVVSIGVGAFSVNQLTSITISNGVTSIPNNAFALNQLTSIIIPSNVAAIGNNAFQNNYSLTNVSFSEGLLSIGSNAFLNCQLSSITLPSTVTSIGSGAFINNSLVNVFSLATVPPVITTTPGNGGTDTFAAIRNTIHLHIPSGTTGAYVTDSGALWTGFNPVTEDAVLNTSNFELANNIKIIATENSIKVLANNQLQLENYTVYNLSGQEIVKGIETEFETTTFSSGIYIVNLNFDKGTVVKKVLIK